MSSRNKTSNVVKNRAPAPIQISAEQIVREAADRQVDGGAFVEPVVKVHDREEYQQHLADRRKMFEDNIRYRREHIGNWVKYSRFEEENSELERARSIFERALEVEPRSAELWLRYAEFELRHEFLQHARNVLDRAVQLLPRVDFLWYKYVWAEELAQDFQKCRAVFERWMEWRPDDNAWLAYARFETRCHKPEAAEQVLRRYCDANPTTKAFVKFAKWAEFEAKNVALARTIYEAALTELEPEEVKQARLFQQFAAMEERQTEYERARVIYQHAITLLKLGTDQMQTDDDEDEEISKQERQKRQELYQQYITFEKKHGDRASIEHVLLQQQKASYEERVKANPYDYDAWFEYVAMLQEHAVNAAIIRDVYERAVAQVPPTTTDKNDWRRYIYLWIYYAVYEELDCRDLDRAVQVYEACLSVIPHAQFSFAKIWIQLAQLHVRQRNLGAARKLLGRALGVCGKERVYQEYIALELALGEVDRCRALYNNYVKAMPHNCNAWCKYAALEQSVGETDRCRALYELAVSQEALDAPEVLWKAYIDFEIDEGDAARARKLYERLLEKTGHVKVWISWAQFECTAIGKGIQEGARPVLENAYEQLKQQPGGSKEERVLLLDAWRVLEKAHGDAASVSQVEAKMPRRIKRKRMREDENGNELGWEEYFDYQFPDEEGGGAANNFKILEMAAKWKEQRQNAGGNSDSDLDSDDDEDE